MTNTRGHVIIYRMWGKIRDFALRSLPYLISIAGGIALFSISLDNVHDPAVEGLISNISASLLAIPLVFLLYDYTTTRVSRQLKKTLVSNLNDKVNTIVLHIVLVLRKILRMRGPVTRANIAAIRKVPESQMTKRMHLRNEYTDMMHEYHEELENLVLGYGKENVLAPEQLRLLSELARDVSRMIEAYRLGVHRRVIAEHIRNIAEEITDWLDSASEVSQNFDQILSNASYVPTTNTNKKAQEK